MRTLKERFTGTRSLILLAVLCGVAIAAGFAGHLLATSSPQHTNHYQLIFERRGTMACYMNDSYEVDGIGTRCRSSNSPLTVDGQDKKEGDTLGIRFYNSYGHEELSGTVRLTVSSGGNYIGVDGNASVSANVQMSTSGTKTWVIRAIIYCS